MTIKTKIMELDLNDWKLVRTSQIEGYSYGLNDGMVFCLIDGTYWLQIICKYKYDCVFQPKVYLYQNGHRQIIVIEGIDDFADVSQVQGLRSHIVSDFCGWSGNTKFKLANNQIWEQIQYQYRYFCRYRPNVVIVNAGGQFIMNVEGNSIRVKKIN